MNTDTNTELRESHERHTKTFDTFEYEGYPVPEFVRKDMVDYIVHHRPTGGFMSAVLENDLRRLLDRGTDYGVGDINAILAWLYNEAPSACWGSPQVVHKWLEGTSAYTVILLYPDYMSDEFGHETYSHECYAASAKEAIKQAQERVYTSYPSGVIEDSEDFYALAVLHGVGLYAD